MAPVVIQGTAVSAPQQTPVSYGGADVQQTSNQQPSKTGCNDPIFGILFYINIAAIIGVVAVYGIPAMESSQNYQTYVYAALVFGCASFVASFVGLLLLMACPALMIKAGLIFSVVIMIVFTILAFMNASYFMGVISLLFLAITFCYVRAVWSRIPFAATNMVTAATAIKANLGVTIFAIFFTILEVGWLVLWAVAVAGIFGNTEGICDANETTCGPLYGYLFLVFLSLYFTQQVLQSCVHVTVAGTVATWWVAPNESGCCSRAVCNSFIRTVTTSFGSICFGSLLVAIIQALRAVANTARNSDDCAIVACIFECILGCLQSIVEYFNKWAYIYVGIYGYSYVESGKAVMQLFRDRGWEAVIADDLVGNAILLLCVVAGLIIGGIGVAYAELNPAFSNLAQGNAGAAFGIGFIAGLFICSVLLSTIASGVNTVIVMFADAPNEFQANHPELSRKMREKWQEFYPGSI